MRPRTLVACAAVLSAVVAAAALWDPRGLRLLRRLSADAVRQESANAALREENTRLSRRARRLSGPGESEALERAARERLGYLRADEVLFKFE
ncbi:MAG: septum formation initiator family protein [Myxococcales bacterium]